MKLADDGDQTFETTAGRYQSTHVRQSDVLQAVVLPYPAGNVMRLTMDHLVVNHVKRDLLRCSGKLVSVKCRGQRV